MDSSEWRRGLNLQDKSEVYKEKGESHMATTKRASIIGIGNCGSQIANEAERSYPETFDTVYINTSEADLNQLVTGPDAMKFKIGNPEDVEGSGKNRSRSREFLRNDVNTLLKNDDFMEMVGTLDYCFIVSSTAGGTGSGAAPILYRLLSQALPNVDFILVFVLPKLGASLMEHGNTLEYLEDIYRILGKDLTYMAYDNETVADMSPLIGPAKVNKDIVEDIKVLVSVDEMGAKYNNIDMQDMKNIMTNPGRLLVARIEKGLTEKALEEVRLDDMFVTAIKKSSNAETDRNNKVDRLGFVTYMTEGAYKLYPDMSHLHEFLGNPPFETHEHNVENTTGKDARNYAYLIAGGLGPINDRTEKINERVAELETVMSGNDKMKSLFDGVEKPSFDTIMKRRDEIDLATTTEKRSVNSVFDDFMR